MGTKENFQLNIKRYKQIAHFHRTNEEKGGGIATFVREGMDSEQIHYSQNNEKLEVAIVRIFGNKSNLDVINLYTNGTHTINETEYQELLKKRREKLHHYWGL